MCSTKSVTLLIGNGINKLCESSNFPLEELLSALRNHSNSNIDLNNSFKPFPLSFEEIVAYKDNTYNGSQQILKRVITDIIKEKQPNPMHELVMKSGVNNIITTNYDYNFEISICKDFLSNAKPSTKESLHSIKRWHSVGRNYPTVWHIHGEASGLLSQSRSYSNSILIGYEQYGSYLYKVKDYVIRKCAIDKKKELSTDLWNALQLSYQDSSWIDLFFNSDVIIMGFGFDFSEIHLWWLLSYRHRIMKNSINGDQPINNSIYFYYDTKCNGTSEDLKKRAICDVLSALGVTCNPFQTSDYAENYKNVLREHGLPFQHKIEIN